MNKKQNELHHTMKQLQTINEMYTTAIKVHRTVESKLQQELQSHVMQEQDLKTLLDKEREIVQKLNSERNELKEGLDDLSKDNEKLQSMLDRISQGKPSFYYKIILISYRNV